MLCSPWFIKNSSSPNSCYNFTISFGRRLQKKLIIYETPLAKNEPHVCCFRCWESWRLGELECFYKDKGQMTKDKGGRTLGLWTGRAVAPRPPPGRARRPWWGEASRRAVTARPEGSPHPTARYVRNKSSAVTSDWTIDAFSLRFTPFIVTSVRCTADSVPVSSLNTAILFASFLA